MLRARHSQGMLLLKHYLNGVTLVHGYGLWSSLTGHSLASPSACHHNSAQRLARSRPPRLGRDVLSRLLRQRLWQGLDIVASLPDAPVSIMTFAT